MADKDGLIFIERKIFAHPLFESKEPMSRMEAWIWMICQAYWRPGQRMVGNTMVKLERGQFTDSIRFMAVAWRWDKNKVSRFLKLLQDQSMVCLKTGTANGTANGTGQIVITICNYDTYQDVNSYRGTANGTANGTDVGQQRDSNGTATGQNREPLKPLKPEERVTQENSVSQDIDALGRIPTRPKQKPTIEKVLTEAKVSEAVGRLKYVSKAEGEHLAIVQLAVEKGVPLQTILDLAVDGAFRDSGKDDLKAGIADWLSNQSIERLRAEQAARPEPVRQAASVYDMTPEQQQSLAQRALSGERVGPVQLTQLKAGGYLANGPELRAGPKMQEAAHG